MKKSSNESTLRFEIIKLSSVLITIFLVASFMFYTTKNKMQKSLDNISITQLNALKYVILSDMMHDGLKSTVMSALLMGSTKDFKDKEEVLSDLKEMSDSFRRNLEELSKLDISKTARDKLNSVQPELEKYIELSNQTIDLALNSDFSKAHLKLGEFEEQFKILEVVLEKFS